MRTTGYLLAALLLVTAVGGTLFAAQAAGRSVEQLKGLQQVPWIGGLVKVDRPGTYAMYHVSPGFAGAPPSPMPGVHVADPKGRPVPVGQLAPADLASGTGPRYPRSYKVGELTADEIGTFVAPGPGLYAIRFDRPLPTGEALAIGRPIDRYVGSLTSGLEVAVVCELLGIVVLLVALARHWRAVRPALPIAVYHRRRHRPLGRARARLSGNWGRLRHRLTGRPARLHERGPSWLGRWLRPPLPPRALPLPPGLSQPLRGGQQVDGDVIDLRDETALTGRGPERSPSATSATAATSAPGGLPRSSGVAPPPPAPRPRQVALPVRVPGASARPDDRVAVDLSSPADVLVAPRTAAGIVWLDLAVREMEAASGQPGAPRVVRPRRQGVGARR